jgi:tetratricopeptide (TPR) repeat protein
LKKNFYILLFIFGIFLFPQTNYAQIDFNKKPDDDLGNVEDAFQEYFFEALKQKGIENHQRAIDALLKCVELDDSKAVVYFELGKNYNKLKNFGSAEDALKTAIAKQPDNEWFLDELYDIYVQQDEFDKAINTVKQLVKYHPDYKQDLASLYIKIEKFKEALLLLDELDSELGISDDRDAMRNQIYSLTGNDKDRIKNLEERVAKNPKNEENHLKLIYRYSELGDTKKAFDTAKQLLETNPDSKLVHLALYKFHLDDNNPEDAIASMQIVLASTEIDAGSKTKVLKDFVRFVAENPEYENDLIEITTLIDENKDAKSSLALGKYYLKSGDKEKALQNYEDALLQEPNNFSLIKDVLLIQLDLNKNKAVVERSNQALELFPAQPILYLINGVANNKLNHAKKAIESLETGLDYIIEDNKMEADFCNQLSIAYKLTNNITKSEAFAKKAETLLKAQ